MRRDGECQEAAGRHKPSLTAQTEVAGPSVAVSNGGMRRYGSIRRNNSFPGSELCYAGFPARIVGDVESPHDAFAR